MEEMVEVVQTLRQVVDRARQSCVDVDTAELRGQVVALQELICAASAAQTVRIAQFAAREEDYDQDGVLTSVDHGVGHVCEFAGDELAPVLGAAPMTAATRARLCVKLCTDLPVTLRALAQGRLDAFRAQVIAEELELADADVCALVEGKIHPRVTGETPGRVRSRVRRALEEVDPLTVRARAIKARADRFVRMCAGHDPGMTSWWASLPAAESLACWAAIDEVAHQMKTEDPTRTLDACRADALIDLILARTEVSTTINIAVPVHTADPGPDPTPDPGTTDPGTGEDRAATPEGQNATATGDAAAAEIGAAAGADDAAEGEAGTRAAEQDSTASGHPGQSFFPPAEDGPGAQQDDCTTPPGFGFATAAHVPGLGVIPPT